MPGVDPVLGIESSCDETAASVVCGGDEIVSNVVASQHARHARFGGIVPEIASRAHAEVVTRTIEAALNEARVSPSELLGVAVTNRPGLLGSLLVGLTAAKTVSWLWDLPLVTVHHLEAHLYAARWTEGIEFPCVAIIASGGHTSLYMCESLLEVRRIGATTDDAAGEAFDKVSAMLGFGYPGGPAIEKAARDAKAGSHKFPRPRLPGRPWDFTFSGLKTAVLYHVRGIPPRPEAIIDPTEFPGVAREFQEAAVDMLSRATIDAAQELGARSITAGGGVAANSRLREVLASKAASAGLGCAFPAKNLCTDNAAVVAGRGYHELKSGARDALDVDVNARPERARYERKKHKKQGGAPA